MAFCFCLVGMGCTSAQPQPINIQSISLDVESDLILVDCHTNDPISVDRLWELVSSAEIILLGELHDHEVGHAFQKQIVDYVFRLFPKSTLALEMLERDEQPLVEDLQDGIISSKKFATLTHSTNWAGKDTWRAWYQPIIDGVFAQGGFVLAANAPRRYVSLARTDGFGAIECLPEHRQALVEVPSTLATGPYLERFFALANHGDEPVDPHDESSELFSFYRSQQVWDATMASSIATLQPTVSEKAVLLVGQFHVEYEGGIVQALEQMIPDAKVLVITVHRVSPDIEFDTVPIADVLVYEQ